MGAATVIRERSWSTLIRVASGSSKPISRCARPSLAARGLQRTDCRPGESDQVDWWHTGRHHPRARCGSAMVPQGPRVPAAGDRKVDFYTLPVLV
jgi:hypothetical protein